MVVDVLEREQHGEEDVLADEEPAQPPDVTHRHEARVGLLGRRVPEVVRRREALPDRPDRHGEPDRRAVQVV